MNLGLSRAAGAQAVAKEIEQAGISLPGGKKKPVTADLVISWRDRLNAGPGAMADFIVEIWRRQPAPGSPTPQSVLQNFRQKVERLAANLKT
jgi:hypothetical protein